MAVPKRKTSKARRNRRSSTWGLQMKSFSKCPNSGKPVLSHTVCLESGYYKGVKVLETKADRAMRRQEKRKKPEMQAAAPEAVATEVVDKPAEETAAKTKKVEKKETK